MKKFTFSKKSSREGFTLVEMIGVLAVIAILTAMLIPKVFESINTARINDAAGAISTIKTATASHYGKYGSFSDSAGSPFIPTDVATNEDAMSFDTKVLMKDKMIEKPFKVKLGDKKDTNKVRIRQVESAGNASDITPASANYDIDGVADVVDTNDGALVVECILTGMSAADARALKDRIDGADIAPGNMPALNEAATLGKVKYPAIAAGQTAEVIIYIAHR